MILVIGLALGVILNVLYTALHPNDSRRSGIFIATLAFTILGLAASGEILNHLATMIPMKMDLYVYRMDGIFWFEASFATGRFLLAHPALKSLAFGAYDGMPLAILGAFTAHLYRNGRPRLLVEAFVINLFLAVPLYVMFPVCGPGIAFSSFPYLPQIAHIGPMALIGPPNGVPSVHTSTALLILFFCWRWRAGRLLASLYLGLIILSTHG